MATKRKTRNPKRVKVYEIYYSYGGRGSAGAVRATSKYEAIYKAVMQWGGRSKDYRAVEEVSNPRRIKGATQGNPVRAKTEAGIPAAVKRAQKQADRTGKQVEVHYRRWSSEGRGSYYWAYYETVYPSAANPRRVKGAKVKGGRSVTLTNFTGRVIRKRNGQVQIIGRIKKR